jgi:hypothetical protein
MNEQPMKRPTVGYAPDGSSKTFDLEPGDELPPGYFDHPDKAKAAGEAKPVNTANPNAPGGSPPVRGGGKSAA